MENHVQEDLCVHLFTVSAGMVGVCLTVIGLIRVVITVGKVDTLADNLLAVDAFLFLLSCFSAYWALRARRRKREMRRLERVADAFFLLAMILMTGICGFIAFAIGIPSR
jgi:hypothetical protein